MNSFLNFFSGIIRVLKTPLKLWSQAQKMTALGTGLGVVLAGLTTTVAVLHTTQPEIPAPEPEEELRTLLR